VENLLLACPAQRGESFLAALSGIGVRAEEARNRDTAMNLLRFVGLEQKASRFAGELSYGEQKLLSLVTCLATGARILIVDEPIAGVHPAMADHILGLLRQLGDTGKAIVFVEHDIGAVRRTADLVIVMDGGRVIARGTPGEILERPEIIEAYLA